MRYHLSSSKSWNDTLDDLSETMEKWRVREWSVTPTRPGKANATGPVTITWTAANGEQKAVKLGTQDTLRLNLRALALSLEEMRMIEVRGMADVFKQVYGGVPVPVSQAPQTGPYSILGVRQDAPWEVVEAAYRARARVVHPDAPQGSTARMQALNMAMDQIRKERGRV